MMILIKKLYLFAFILLIINPLEAQILHGYITNPSPNCSDGTIRTSMQSGLPPFYFQWSNGSTSSYLENIPSGNYCVTVTDAFCCQSIRCFQLNDNGIIELTRTQNPSGDGLCDGFADVTATGAGEPFTFQWSNGETTEDLSNLCSGNYSVTVTSNKGCSKVFDFSIGKACYDDPALMNRNPQPLIVQPNVTSTSNGVFNNGSIVLNVQSGEQPYYFNWSGDNGFRAREHRIQNLSVGTYCVSVTDACGQSYSQCFTINDCSKGEPIHVPLNTDGKSCNRVIATLPGTTVKASPYGGTPPYTYLWSTGHTTNPLRYARPGQYFVTVTDSKSCKAVSTVEVEDSYSEIQNGCLINAFCDGNSVGNFINPSEASIDESQLASKCQIIINCKNTSNVILQGIRKRLPSNFRLANCVDGEFCEFTLSGQTFGRIVSTIRLKVVSRELRPTCPDCYGCFEITTCPLTGQELSVVQISPSKCPPPPRPISPFLNEQEVIATIPDKIEGIKIARTKTELDSIIKTISRIQIDPQNGVFFGDDNPLNHNDDLYRVYPNPFDNNILLDYVSNEAKEIEVEMVNLYGQQVFTKTFHSIKGNNSHVLQLDDNYPNGIYILRMKGQDSILYTTKLIKSK
jgi:hypothetical protein